MPTKLKFFKVNSLPSVLTPSSLYFIKNDNTGLMSLYLTDTGGTISYRTHDTTDIIAMLTNYVQSLIGQPNGIAGLDASGNLIGNLLAIIDGQDTAATHNGNFIWKDLSGEFTVRNLSGGNNPTWGTIFDNLQGLVFSASTMNQVWVNFHINHDIALGTKVYPHIHWLPLTNASGTVRWGIEYSVAKGHGQQVFHPSVTVYVNHTIPANSFKKHFVSEVSEADAIPPTNIEPDSFVKVRVFRDAKNALDTYPGEVHAWFADLHYQAERIGTMNKAPNFFG